MKRIKAFWAFILAGIMLFPAACKEGENASISEAAERVNCEISGLWFDASEIKEVGR